MDDTIIAIDDEELELELLTQIFGSTYNVITALDGRTGLQKINDNYDSTVAVLLDLTMPGLNGFQVLQLLKANDLYKDIPVAVVTASDDTSLEMACYAMGALAVIHKPFNSSITKKQVENIIDMYEVSKELKSNLNEQLTKLNNFYDHLVDVISNLVEFRDVESGAHIKRVKGMTRIMVDCYRELFPEAGLTAEESDRIVRASALHDVGKISVPDHILTKPGSLTDEEREIMQEHTTKGCEILKLLAGVEDEDQLKVAYDICRYHHERFDGNGYPDRLAGRDIPLAAQLVSIVDVYDALVSKRVYKEPYSKEKSYEMIINGECGVFSPNIIKCFEQARQEMEAFSDSCC